MTHGIDTEPRAAFDSDRGHCGWLRGCDHRYCGAASGVNEISKRKVAVIWAISALSLGALWYAARGLGYRVSLPDFLVIVASVIVAGWFNRRFPGRRKQSASGVDREDRVRD
jgi:hypothetical protein